MTFNQTGGMSDNALALLDDTLQPLKRNHACLQCKKRKVKCDAVSLIPPSPNTFTVPNKHLNTNGS